MFITNSEHGRAAFNFLHKYKVITKFWVVINNTTFMSISYKCPQWDRVESMLLEKMNLEKYKQFLMHEISHMF